MVCIIMAYTIPWSVGVYVPNGIWDMIGNTPYNGYILLIINLYMT